MVAASAVTSGPSSSTNTPSSSGGSSVPFHLPVQREVARPVQNLGNTCYINAVLQALAHAPELCLAMDCDPHYPTCPIFQENNRRRQSSPSMSPEGDEDPQHRRIIKPAARPKLRRSSRKSPTSGFGNSSSNYNSNNNNDNNSMHNNGNGNSSMNDTVQDKYCALCEMEHHLEEVHSLDPSSKEKDKAVAPHSFVSGFIEHVAPWFKVGQQEDSHEFLRLLIDAMQRSCKNARPKPSLLDGGDDALMEEDIPPLPEDAAEMAANKAAEEAKDVEYPFQLFRGTVESCVTCDSCKATSSTLDPIEDVGLEVTPHMPHANNTGVSTRGSVSSPSNSSNFEALADVSSAFQRFARVENLDAGYKCETCGKGGRATKQSRLASIPPILTLHLKRFRYGGDTRGPSPAFSTGNRRSKSASSGSSKIEGHIKFEIVFDLKPYLTDELQAKHKKMFCRLFAVIVHAGKNSHSGHYVAFVRNIVKNEWWKMDDARITVATVEEVMQAEAYMLFYRVLDHPVAVQLEERAKKMRKDYEERQALQKRLAEEAEELSKKKQEEISMAATDAAETEKENVPVAAPVADKKKMEVDSSAKEDAAATAAATTSAKATSSSDPPKAEKKQSASNAAPSKVAAQASAANSPKSSAAATANSSPTTSANSRKRGIPEYPDGRTWARANTRLKTYTSIHSAEDYINENVQFTSDYFKVINEEGNKPNARIDHCPIKNITRDDIVGGFGRWEKGLKHCIFRLAKRYEEENGEDFFSVPVAAKSEPQASSTASTTLVAAADKLVAVGNATGDDSLL